METLVRNVVWDLDTISGLLTALMMPSGATSPLVCSSLLFPVFTEQVAGSSGHRAVAAMGHERGFSAAAGLGAGAGARVTDNRPAAP
jgi:hypothetical protein